MPNKKWYLMLDDDTYLVQPSLKLLLDHLDPSVPYYIGNAVGDYKARFAHGGSGVILSHAAIRKLFSHPKVVAAAHLESLDETWGDRLLATTLVKLGVYLDESFVTFFNGENPSKTKLTWQRFCSPIISFHSLTSPEEMETASRVSKNATSPVRWMDLWDVSGAPPLDSPTWDSGHEDWDHVGRLDETVMVIDKISNQQDCARICTTRKTCLAWTWESKTRACHLSPWMIPGERAVGKVSGIKVPRVKAMLGSVDCAGY